MKAIALTQSLSCRSVASVSRPQTSRPFTASRIAPQQRASVKVAFFKFGKNGASAEAAGIVGSQGRDDYTYDDVEQYFNYMGFLATEGTYDRMDALVKSGLHSIDIILLLACSENDFPKIQEILGAGADPTVKSPEGKTPLDLASKKEVTELLQQALAKFSKV